MTAHRKGFGSPAHGHSRVARARQSQPYLIQRDNNYGAGGVLSDGPVGASGGWSISMTISSTNDLFYLHLWARLGGLFERPKADCDTQEGNDRSEQRQQRLAIL